MKTNKPIKYKIPICKTCWYRRHEECPGMEYDELDLKNETCGMWRDKDIDLVDRSSQGSDKRGKKQRYRGRGQRGGGYDGQS